MEDSIKTLWVEMQVSGQRRFCASFNLMVFWKRRMRNATRVPWARAALAYLGRFPEFSMPRFSSLFLFLLPEERKKFLEALNYAEDDDLRVCAHAMTKDEEEHMLLNNWWYPVKLLRSYLDWPFQSLFIQTAEKLWNRIDHYSFFSFAGLHFLETVRRKL
ncbi:hypothetical protein AVEN_161180-1 [Araneus ventricosus]|uniref:Uncharacterized protein n=1 Tax=Araneus ventricosus TaxID=182803 RepID=A0A4Y2L1G9_ARAVE|nr:hypothetical protein AVEN_161180-1 [Araneus ventricosus]